MTREELVEMALRLGLGDEAMKLLHETQARAAYQELADPDSRLAGFNFSYANLAASTRHKPQRKAFAKLARERGMPKDVFEAWARKRRWWVGGQLEFVAERSAEQLGVLRLQVIQSPFGGIEPTGGFTCDACEVNATCAYAYDPYNTDGDCLANK